MTNKTLHIFSNRHIRNEVHNIKKNDLIVLENSLSRKRWSLYFDVNGIDERKLNITYLTSEEYFEMTINLKNKNEFNIVGNPPYNDDQNEKDNTGNYVSASKKVYLDYIDKALELASEVKLIVPVRGWWVGKNKNKYLKKYTKLGLYLVENKGMPFDNAITGEIGVFHFSKNKKFVRDEFAQEEPLKNNITTQYKMYTMVGKKTPGALVEDNVLSDSGKYRVVLTSTKIKYTDDDNLFEDPTRGNWRVGFNHNGNKDGKSIYAGPMQVISPTDYLSMSMSCFVIATNSDKLGEKKAEAICKYMMSDEVMDIIRKNKVSNTNSKYHMSFVPPYVD